MKKLTLFLLLLIIINSCQKNDEDIITEINSTFFNNDCPNNLIINSPFEEPSGTFGDFDSNFECIFTNSNTCFTNWAERVLRTEFNRRRDNVFNFLNDPNFDIVSTTVVLNGGSFFEPISNVDGG